MSFMFHTSLKSLRWVYFTVSWDGFSVWRCALNKANFNSVDHFLWNTHICITGTFSYGENEKLKSVPHFGRKWEWSHWHWCLFTWRRIHVQEDELFHIIILHAVRLFSVFWINLKYPLSPFNFCRFHWHKMLIIYIYIVIFLILIFFRQCWKKPAQFKF